MAAKTVSFETGHEEMIHDAAMDYYGRRVATASSDRSVRIFDVAANGERQTLTATLKGYDGPVWQVAWAHPKFGSLLATASYDGRVVVWREAAANQWMKIFEDIREQASINAVAWAPHTFGLILTAAGADGQINVYTRKENNTWDQKQFVAHKGGVNAVSWGPDMKSGSLLANAASVANVKFERRFVTAGCDNRIRIWRYVEEPQPPQQQQQQQPLGQWLEQKVFSDSDASSAGHSDWVRDVAWAPSVGLPTNTIASCSEDKTVIIWTEDSNGVWKKAKTLQFEHKVWRVSWSVQGNILAVSQGDNQVSLWKESVDGEWTNLAHVHDKGHAPGPAQSPSQHAHAHAQ